MTARSLVLALALLPVAASATVVLQLSLEELTTRAPLVVRGTVERSQSAGRADGSIWTSTSLIVTETLKGVGISKVTLKQPGGDFGDLNQSVTGTAKFTEGEDVVVFLEPSVDEKNVYVVLGMASGKVGFELVHGQKLAVRHLDGLSFAKSGSRQLERVENFERLGSVDAFLKRIRTAATSPAVAKPPSSLPVRGVK